MGERNSISARLQILINHFCSGNNSAFSRSVGIKESTIRSYLSGTQPKLDALQKISKIFAISCEWLLLGEGDMLKSDNKNININDSFYVGDNKGGRVHVNKSGNSKTENSKGTDCQICKEKEQLIRSLKEQLQIQTALLKVLANKIK